MARWYVLGFTMDDVVACWQDARLASECVRVWNVGGRPSGFEVLQVSGDDGYLYTWYVSDVAAGVLDTHGVAWRSFLIGEAEAAPVGAQTPLVGASSPKR